MNKQNGNMYDFVSHTSNPIKGLCPHECSYCYMHGIYARYKNLDQNMRLDEKELCASYGRNKFVFIGSSTDMYAQEVPTDWILRVYSHCLEYGENRYLFQSKNPQRFLEPDLINHPLMRNKGSIFFATTIETNREEPVVSRAQSMRERAVAMTMMRKLGFGVMITIEPIMDFDLDELLSMMKLIRPFQVNIGCNTSRSVHLPEPSRAKLIAFVENLRQLTSVKLKSNSSRILGNLELI